MQYQKNFKNNAEATLYDHERHLRFWAKALSYGAGDISLDAIGIKDIDCAVNNLSATHKAVTIRKYIQSLFTFGRWARGRNKVPANVALNWIDMDLPRPDGKVRAAYSLDDFERLMLNWPAEGQHVARIIWMMIFTGGRPGTLRPVKWRQIKIDYKTKSGHFPLRKSKGGSLEMITFKTGSAIHRILDDAKRDFERFYRRSPGANDYVFVARPRKNNKPIMWSASGLSHTVSFHAKKAAVSARIYDSFVAYNSRHSILTWLAREGVSEELRARFVGHNSTAMQQVYVHLSGEDARPQREAVDALLGEVYNRSKQGKFVIPESEAYG